MELLLCPSDQHDSRPRQLHRAAALGSRARAAPSDAVISGRRGAQSHDCPGREQCATSQPAPHASRRTHDKPIRLLVNDQPHCQSGERRSHCLIAIERDNTSNCAAAACTFPTRKRVAGRSLGSNGDPCADRMAARATPRACARGHAFAIGDHAAGPYVQSEIELRKSTRRCCESVRLLEHTASTVLPVRQERTDVEIGNCGSRALDVFLHQRGCQVWVGVEHPRRHRGDRWGGERGTSVERPTAVGLVDRRHIGSPNVRQRRSKIRSRTDLPVWVDTGHPERSGIRSWIGFADGSAVPRRLPGRVDRQPRRRTRPLTVTTYSSAVGNHVTETARGRTPIGKIRRAHIRAHAAELVKAGVGAARRNVVAAVISRALADALADDLIPSNPCAAHGGPGNGRSDPKRFTVWTPAEFRVAARPRRG